MRQGSDPHFMLTRPVRGIDVTYIRQTSCPSDFVVAVVDFEPATTYEFVSVASGRGDNCCPWFKDAFIGAMRRELGHTAIRVRLTKFKHHCVDSGERQFERAATHAARTLYCEVSGRLSAPVRGLSVGTSGEYVNGKSYSARITLDAKPADAYEFACTAGPGEAEATAIDAWLRTELGDAPVRVAVTGGQRSNLPDSSYDKVAHRAALELRRCMEPGATESRGWLE
jgi:hypothetical protein